MSWSQAFRAEIDKAVIRPRFVIESLYLPGFQPGTAQLFLSSHDEGEPYQRCIAAQGHRILPPTLHPGDWSIGLSEVTIALTGSFDPRGPPKGQLLALKVGFAGWAVSDYQQVFVGYLNAISRTGGAGWNLTIRSVLSALLSRSTQSTNQGQLFYDLPYETTIALFAYTPGDANVFVASSAGARETGGNYLLEITPDSGDPFFITSTGSAVNVFSGLPALATLGTTAAAASIGNKVRVLAYIEDHPVNIVRKLMVSTGLATSTYDTLPAAWGFFLPTGVVDDGDMDHTIDVINTGTSATSSPWRVYADKEQADGLSWISSWLAPAGLFLTEVQGRVTVRCALGPDLGALELVTVTDADIASIDEYQTWDPNQPVEYGRHRLISPTGSQNNDEQVDSIPSAWRLISELPYLSQSESTWRGNVAERASPWVTRLAETLELTLIGLRHSWCGVGGSVFLNSSKVPPGRIATDLPWKILSVATDWFRGTVTLRLARISNYAEEF